MVLRPKRRLEALFRAEAASALEAEGFTGEGVHFIRRQGRVTQVIELQHSIYGLRVTANLGLDLEWLKPPVRWIPRPALGPHAHDSARWVRLGLTTPERADRWWSFEEDDASIAAAARALAAALLSSGLDWLERESSPEAFLRFAEERLRRSEGVMRAVGSYLDLRLLTAVHAWRGDREAAEAALFEAKVLWPEQKARLAEARRHYKERHVGGSRLAGVPDLHKELERVVGELAAGPPPLAPR